MLGIGEVLARQLARGCMAMKKLRETPNMESPSCGAANRVTPRQSVPGGRRGGYPLSQQMSYADTRLNLVFNILCGTTIVGAERAVFTTLFGSNGAASTSGTNLSAPQTDLRRTVVDNHMSDLCHGA